MALEPRLRRTYLASAARTLYTLWQEAGDLSRLPPEVWAWTSPTGTGVMQLLLPPASLRTLPQPHRHAEVVRILADWQAAARGIVQPAEQFHFLRTFLRPESIDPPTFRRTALRIGRRADTEVAEENRRLYLGFLRQPAPPGLSPVTGIWKPEPQRSAREIGQALEALEASPDTQIVKSSAFIRVLRGQLWGHDVMVKRYDLPKGLDRLKYYFRPSRARRAWAAGETLHLLGHPTPQSLGYWEAYEGRLPVRSYWITAFLGRSTSLYRWSKACYRQLPDASRAALRRDVMNALLALYDAGIYHADTKSPNLLVTQPTDDAQRKLYWTDLESMAVGTRISRHHIVRNLVQLNGSLRHWVPDAERWSFLDEFARAFPWVRKPRVVRRIQGWTRRRLLKELRRHTPPEGVSHRGL